MQGDPQEGGDDVSSTPLSVVVTGCGRSVLTTGPGRHVTARVGVGPADREGPLVVVVVAVEHQM